MVSGCSILSSSFTDENTIYYYVGIAYAYHDNNESQRGQILVFLVEYGQLQLVNKKEKIKTPHFIEFLPQDTENAVNCVDEYTLPTLCVASALECFPMNIRYTCLKRPITHICVLYVVR